MVDPYAAKRARVAAVIKRWNSGTITLTRKTPGEREEGAGAWTAPPTTLDVYALDARVDGVAAEHVDGTLILATDRVVIMSPKARHTYSDGEPVTGTPTVDLEPRPSDVLQIDGKDEVIKKIEAVPAAGPAAMFHIFVAA